MNIYCEKQEGDLCRMHSLNNFFQKREMNTNKFYEYCDAYDKYYKTKNSRSIDMFNEGRNVIGFVLKQYYNIFTLLVYDLNLIKKFLPDLSNIFSFSKNHIFIYKKINNEWFKIDSLSRPQKQSPLTKNFGYLIVIPEKLKKKFENLFIEQIKNSKIYNTKNKKEFFSKNLLGDAEIPLCNLHYLSNKYPVVNKIIKLFRENINNKNILMLFNNQQFLNS